jgi:hypothetical protein
MNSGQNAAVDLGGKGRRAMRPRFRKLEVKDVRDIEKLVTENAENIEAGLKIIDSCLLLGHARVDLVGVDARDSLVLTTLGFTANEDMLLRALEAYSWVLEFPETVRRLYPRTRFHPGRLPRVLFIAERMPDAFVRKVKQLNFAEMDCLTFLNLEVNGNPAVYFDPVEQIRRNGESPLVESQVDPDLPVDQHPFIEGEPPETPWDDPDGNAAWQHRLAETERGTEPVAEAREGIEAGWQQMITKLAGDPMAAARGLVAEAPRPSAVGSTLSMESPAPDTAGPLRADNIEQYKGEWREFLDRLGTAQLPSNGKLSRGPNGFASQFDTTE